MNGPEGTIEFLGEGTGQTALRIESDFVNQGVVRIDNTVAGIKDTQWTNEGLIDILPGADLLVRNDSTSVTPELINEGVIRVPDGARLMVANKAIFHPKNGRFDKLFLLGSDTLGRGTLGEGTNRDDIFVYGQSFASGQFTNAESGRIKVVSQDFGFENPCFCSGNLRGRHASLSIVDGSEFQNLGLIELTSELGVRTAGNATITVQEGSLVNSPTGVIEYRRQVGDTRFQRRIDGELINHGTVRLVRESVFVSHWTNTGIIDLTENSDLGASGSNAHLVNDGVILGTVTITRGAKFTPANGQFDRVRLVTTRTFGIPNVLGAGVNRGVIDVHGHGGGGNKIEGDFVNGPDGIINIAGLTEQTGTPRIGDAMLHIVDASKFQNQGLIRLTSRTGIDYQDGATLTASGGAIVNAPGGMIESLTGLDGGHRIIDAPVTNQGVVRAVDASITFNGQLTNSGQIQIGRSKTLSVAADLELTNDSNIMVEVDGVNGNARGQLRAGDGPTLAGELSLVVANGATFSDQGTFNPVSYSDRRGQFDAIKTTNLAETITIDQNYTATALQITATVPGTISPPDPPPVNPFDEFRDLVENPPARPDLSNSFGTAVPADRTRDPIENPILPSAGPPSFQLTRPTTQLTYDPQFNQLTLVIDPLGRQRLFELDPANGNTLTSIEVIGLPDTMSDETDDLVTSYTYTALDQIDTVTDPLGRITDFGYDEFGRTVLSTVAVGTEDEATVQFAYDDAGNLTGLTDENGNTTSFTYDSLNRLTGITEPDPDGDGPLESPVSTFAYDERGNLASATDAAGSTSRSVYDALDRLIQQIDDDDNLLQFRYDAKGNLLTTIDPLGNITRNVYDTRDRLIESVDPDGGVTSFSYDAASNLTSLTDPVGNETTFSYDVRNRLVSETDPLGNPIAYEYDLVDNLIRKTDRNDRVTEFAYDDIDRLVAETWINVDASIANQIDYTYDAASNLLSVGDQFSALAFTYDARDRGAQVDNAGTPGAPNVVLDYAYDGVGNVLSVTDTIEGVPGATTSYEYDALNRQTQITQTGNEVSDKRVDLVYNALGQFASIDRFSDLDATQPVVRTAYTYDALNRLVDLRHSNTTEDVAFYEYTYDSSSRITSINDIDGLTTYSYDDRDQLTGADRAAGDIRGDESYTYDANGNRVQSHLHDDGYVTGEANRLLSDGTYNYEYDNEGNMTRRTEIASGDYRVFEWDHRNRLIAANDFAADDTPVQEVGFSYDAFGRRIKKSVDGDPTDNVGSIVKHFAYDAEDVLLEFVGSDVSGGNRPAFKRRYLHGPLIDQVMAQESANEQPLWLLADQIGSTRLVIGVDGRVEEEFTYDSYGNVTQMISDEIDTSYLFAGREYDQELSIYFNRTRYYDPHNGRFLSSDTKSFGGGDSNLYRYVFNSPNDSIDPFGENRLLAKLLENGLGALLQKLEVIQSVETLAAKRSGLLGDAQGFRNEIQRFDDQILELLRRNEKDQKLFECYGRENDPALQKIKKQRLDKIRELSIEINLRFEVIDRLLTPQIEKINERINFLKTVKTG